MTAVVQVRTYPVGAGVGLEVVEVDTDTAAVRTVLVDYQQPDRDLHEAARSYATLHGLTVVTP